MIPALTTSQGGVLVEGATATVLQENPQPFPALLSSLFMSLHRNCHSLLNLFLSLASLIRKSEGSDLLASEFPHLHL